MKVAVDNVNENGEKKKFYNYDAKLWENQDKHEYSKNLWDR